MPVDLRDQPRLVAQLLERDRRARGQRMVGGDRDPHLVVGDRQVVDARPLLRTAPAATARSSPRRSARPAARRAPAPPRAPAASARRPAGARAARASRPAAARPRRTANAPTRTCARPMPAASRTASSARRAASSSADACRTSTSPAGVSVTPRALRSSTRVPSADLEPRDVLGHRGLREVERRGGLAEGPADGDLAKRRQELQVEHHGPLCHSQQLIIGHDRRQPAPCCP